MTAVSISLKAIELGDDITRRSIYEAHLSYS
jgi:hypothetical protein